jgi:hypothetical protein
MFRSLSTHFAEQGIHCVYERVEHVSALLTAAGASQLFKALGQLSRSSLAEYL